MERGRDGGGGGEREKKREYDNMVTVFINMTQLVTFHLSLAQFFFICSLTVPWMFLFDARPPDILNRRQTKIKHTGYTTYSYMQRECAGSYISETSSKGQ